MSDVNTSPPTRLSLDEKVRLFKRRFAARQDAFYEKKTVEGFEVDTETGQKIRTSKSLFQLVCSNYGDESLCLIAQRKGKCSECTNRKNEVLNDNWIKSHITGSRALCLIPLTPDGVKMGAIDFDRSVSDGLMAVFEDAKRVRDYCREMGVEGYIARSSNKGYHLYFWFNDWIPAHHFTSFALHALKQTGFSSRLETHGLPLPEVFPKQTLFDKSAAGNGIRAPLSEQDMRNGRNCFVSDQAEPFPLEQQWVVVRDMVENDAKKFDEAGLKKLGVMIFTSPVARSARKKKHVRRITNPDGSVSEVEEEIEEKSGPIQQHGSFWNVVAACPAMQEYWAKAPNGQYAWDISNPRGLFHGARVASMNLAIATTDGEDALLKRWPSEHTRTAVDSAKKQGYKPCTCRWMQEQGVCRLGKHPKFEGKYCFKRLPPVHIENGKVITNPENLPEEVWPDPSPIRFAANNNLDVDDIKERFKALVAAMKWQAKQDAEIPETELDENGQPIVSGIFTPENAASLLDGLVQRVAKLKKSERDEVTGYVLAQKIFTKTDWASKLKDAGVRLVEEKKQAAAKDYKSFVFKSRSYFLRDGRIVCMYTDGKGNPHEEEFANFWIERTHEPALIRIVEKNDRESTIYEDRTYKLTIHVSGQARPITIPNKIFANPGLFFESVRAAGGSELQFSVSKESYDVMMCAISNFSDPIAEKYALREIGYLPLKGGTKYIMPSVIVTKDEITRNDTYVLEFNDELARALDFQILSDDRWKEVARHIVSDFFNCNNPMLTMTCFAHAMASVCTPMIESAVGWRKGPVVWIAGTFGKGKTFVAENSQFFFGDFTGAGQASAGGTSKGSMGAADLFRHSLLTLDDHKDSLSAHASTNITTFVQRAYDRSTMPALQRNGERRTYNNRARGLVAITGEDFPDREASAVSRLIVIDVDLKPRNQEGEKVVKMRRLYSGFTPYVVRHMLQMDNETVARLWKEFYLSMYEGSSESDNRDSVGRICENLTLNYFGFRVAVDTMVSYGAISQIEAENLARQHRTNLLLIKAQQLQTVREARGSQVFVEDLRQLLADPVRYKIDGWPGSDTEEASRASSLGFYTPKEPGIIFIYPEIAYNAVAIMARNKRTTLQSRGHIARQLAEDKCFADAGEPTGSADEKRHTWRRRTPSGTIQRVYPIKAEVLGFDAVSGKAAEKETPRKVAKISSKEDGFVLE